MIGKELMAELYEVLGKLVAWVTGHSVCWNVLARVELDGSGDKLMKSAVAERKRSELCGRRSDGARTLVQKDCW
jgi:hypothetical protein